MSRHLPSFCTFLIGLVCLVKPIELKYVQVRNRVTGNDLGTVRGSVMETYSGRSFNAFRGIPYAKPPINELRFKDPIPADPWEGVYDATEDSVMCPQKTYNASYKVSEDCLFLNVYSRWLPTTRKQRKKLLPVIVYIHPGAYIIGSGTSEYHAGPEYIMDRDVILVTFNYRLGVLGFLATGTEDSPGNYGLKDHVLVLEWVRDYIKNFGGNPNLVTIMGYSCGGVSASLHMVSPLSRGLFHRAIAMSGSETVAFTVPHDQLDLAKRQARIFNCPENNTKEMVNCLRKVDAIELALSLSQLYNFAGTCPDYPVQPVIEGNFGQKRFLTQDPTRQFQLGHFEQVPLLTGIVKNELLFLVIPIVQSSEYLQQLDEHFNDIAPNCFGYDSGTEQSRIASEVLRETFLPRAFRNDSRTFVGLLKLFSDGIVGFPMHRLVELASQYTRVYYYENTYAGRYSYTDYANGYYSPAHFDDVNMLISMKSIGPLYTRRDRESLNIERLTRLWTEFARTGNPNKRYDPYLSDIIWRRSSDDRFEYLRIGEEVEMKEYLHKKRYEVWDRLFPLKPLPIDC